MMLRRLGLVVGGSGPASSGGYRRLVLRAGLILVLVVGLLPVTAGVAVAADGDLVWADRLGGTIDDVGTGHSGLSYILKLGVDIIKIDKMFIDAVGIERSSTTIIETLVDLAHNMRMEVIAEGVENFEQVVCLRERGVRAAQGFVFAPPLPGSSFLQLIEAIDPVATESAPAHRTRLAVA